MRKAILYTIICLIIPLVAIAQQTNSENFNLKKGVAIEGYDPVSYFQKGPRQGVDTFSTNYNGITYWFSSAKNRDLFKATPEKYEPAYGGWCAYAMGASGDKVKIDPKTFKIVDNELYLFYNFRNQNTLFDWNKEEAALKKAGDVYWHKIIN